jgi:hypothetical protein
MKGFMIYDLRFMISRRPAGGTEDFDQLNSFGLQSLHAFGIHQTSALGNLDPQVGFIRFFQHSRDLVDEVRARFAPQRRTLVGCHRTTAPRDLIGDGPSRRLVGQRVGQFQHAHRELNAPFFEFCWVHRWTNLPNVKQSSIVNHKS